MISMNMKGQNNNITAVCKGDPSGGGVQAEGGQGVAAVAHRHAHRHVTRPRGRKVVGQPPLGTHGDPHRIAILLKDRYFKIQTRSQSRNSIQLKGW